MLSLLFFILAALKRPVDGDEGFYLYAARMVASGHVPYRDFLYPQSPGLPYLWAPLSAVSRSWYSARVLAALLASAIAWLIHAYASRKFSPLVAAVCVLVFATTSMALNWFTVVKTYGVASALLLGAFLCLPSAVDEGRDEFRFGAPGLLLGLSVEVRLNFVLVTLAFVPAVLVTRRRAAQRIAAISGGFLLAMIPALLLALTGLRRLSFDLLGYQTTRSTAGAIGNFQQKRAILLQLFGLKSSILPVEKAQFDALLILAVCGAVLAWRRRGEFSTPLLMAVLLGITCLLPTPSYTQYFVVLVPFLIVAAADVVDFLASQPRRTEALAAVGVALLAVAALLEFRTFESSAAQGAEWRINAIERVSRAANSAAQGREVITWWPGYEYEGTSSVYPGLEDHFGVDAAALLTQSRAREVHVITRVQLRALIRARRAPVVVLGNWGPGAGMEPLIRSSGYTLVASVKGAEVFSLKPPLRAAVSSLGAGCRVEKQRCSDF